MRKAARTDHEPLRVQEAETFGPLIMFLDDAVNSGRTLIFPSPDDSHEVIHANEQDACRSECGACCIAPSISSSIPGMPDGKPAGVRCIQLSRENQCERYGMPDRPAVCLSYQASESCGTSREDALRLFEELESMTGSANLN